MTMEAFATFGVETISGVLQNQARADCIFCHKEKHFWINETDYRWDCKKCGRSGNLAGFFSEVLSTFGENTSHADFRRLAISRGGAATPSAYKRAGMVFDSVGGRWVMPIKSAAGALKGLMTWMEKTKRRWMNVPGCKHELWNAHGIQSQGRIWVCEGHWDGIALSDLIKRAKIKNESVVAVPGVDVMKLEWLQLFAGRNVVMAYDADASGDRVMTGKPAEKLASAAKSVKFVRWPLDVEDGYDVSDLILDMEDKAWTALNRMASDSPRTKPETGKSQQERKTAGRKKKKASFDDVMGAYKKHYKTSGRFEMAVKMVCSACLTAEVPGDPLWFFLVAPPGHGKTVILNPFRHIEGRVEFRSNIGPKELVSGWQGASDPSLIPKLDKRTLIMKDITELLTAPHVVQEEVFGIMRGAFDGNVERSYGNAVYRKYESHFNVVAGVTDAIYGHSKASMGERMLKFQMTHQELDHDDVIREAMMRGGRASNKEEEIAEKLASFLESNVNPEEEYNKIPTWAFNSIMALSQLISRVRGEVEREFDETVRFKPGLEIGTRLAVQLHKLAMALAFIGGEYTRQEHRLVEKVAFDTAIGWNLDVIQTMMKHGGKMTRPELVQASGLPKSNVRRRLEDLEILRMLHPRKIDGPKNKPHMEYVLDKKVVELWKRAKVFDDHVAESVSVRKRRLARNNGREL